MPIKLLLLLMVAAAIWYGVNWFIRTPPTQARKALKKGALYALIGVFALLVLTGRLPWLFALAAAAVPLLQRGLTLLRLVPMVQQLLAGIGMGKAARGPSGGQQSRVNTAWLSMTLDHDSGAMEGEVLQGGLRGKRLSELSLSQLLALRGDCDPQSLQLLDTWLDREHDGWREQPGAEHSGGSGATPTSTAMDRAEALAILGLQEGADNDAIKAAHRRLMQRLHPDRGGSDWLAARINEAKSLLMKGK